MPRRVHLLMYDLTGPAERESVRLFLRDLGVEGEDWIRLQKSVLMVRWLGDQASLMKEFRGWLEEKNQSVAVFDVSESAATAVLAQDKWDWYVAARPQAGLPTPPAPPAAAR